MTRPGWMVRNVRARPRLFIAAAGGAAVGVLLPAGWIAPAVTRFLLAWNVGSITYIALSAFMMLRSTHEQMRLRARSQDDGKHAVLAFVVISAIASLVGIAGEWTLVKNLQGTPKLAHAALTGVTVLTSWVFIQVMFALHYAHDFYAAMATGARGGLAFPQDEAPNYGDFFYFAISIGTSGQPADVSFTSKPMRRIGSVHCTLAYFFNTTVLALLINIGATLM